MDRPWGLVTIRQHSFELGYSSMVDEWDAEDALASSAAVSTALSWLQTIRDGDFDRTWSSLTGEFRLALVQSWITQNAEVIGNAADPANRDRLAADLAGVKPGPTLWPAARKGIGDELRRVTVDWAANREIGAGSRPRPIGVDLELVRLFPLDQFEVDDDGHRQFLPGQVAESLSVVVRHDATGWLVAGVTDVILHPGWPPRHERIVSPGD